MLRLLVLIAGAGMFVGSTVAEARGAGHAGHGHAHGTLHYAAGLAKTSNAKKAEVAKVEGAHEIGARPLDSAVMF
jgi:hypothetical protein